MPAVNRLQGISKPGSCPLPTGHGLCVMGCFSDASCPGAQKCVRHLLILVLKLHMISNFFLFNLFLQCSNGCGHMCMEADGDAIGH